MQHNMTLCVNAIGVWSSVMVTEVGPWRCGEDLISIRYAPDT